MGTFIGHVYPGLFLVLYGLHQAVAVSRAMIAGTPLPCPPRAPRNKGRWAWLWTLSYAGLLKTAAGSLLVAYEISCVEGGLVLMDRQLPPRFMYPHEWQHLTMFALLALLGCVELVSGSLLPRRCVALEKGALALTFYELLLLLGSHVKDSSGVELQVHALLVLVVLLLSLVLTAQLWAPAARQLRLMESFLFLVMGSWLVQAGFILYRPISGFPWQDDDVSDIMFVTTFFCWHVMADALCLLGVHGFSFFWLRCYGPRSEPAGSTGAPCHAGPRGPLYTLLQEAEQSEKEEGALLLPQAQPGP
ncbi:transmembrane epididymal protein 1-like [Oryctolagus cuniculus]|uniref:transmembrane epididymal protein 1-like n=1 Tax=Oryctolagus cuniculus TaxID=9986 RepID=UPI00223158B6|nr:transmembrane epididymal protein 1-like [Oryctolagus cuniculus]